MYFTLQLQDIYSGSTPGYNVVLHTMHAAFCFDLTLYGLGPYLFVHVLGPIDVTIRPCSALFYKR